MEPNYRFHKTEVELSLYNRTVERATGHDPLPATDEQVDYCVYMAFPFEDAVAFLAS